MQKLLLIMTLRESGYGLLKVCLHLNLIPMKCLAFPLSLQRKMHGLIQQGPDPVTEQTKEAL